MKKALYTYFGLLDLHEIDSPGHSLYQLGLLDELSYRYDIDKFDFHSYYPEELYIDREEATTFPDTPHGKVFNEYYSKLIDTDYLVLDAVLRNIKDHLYSKLFLKARFRNLSTLDKKWKDARDFELILDTAILSGYDKSDIIILDTDLSLSTKFIDLYDSQVTIIIPSIHINGISDRFLQSCISINTESKCYTNSAVYYGNIDTSNYKAGNNKSLILNEVLDATGFSSPKYVDDNSLTLICKPNDYVGWLGDRDPFIPVIKNIHRSRRSDIFSELEQSSIMINVTKDKYNDVRFIPARIYEALIFGLIPISYKFKWLSSVFSFETIEDYREILYYLYDIEHDDKIAAYKRFVQDYRKYSDSMIINYNYKY
jgi:hypothetical protein